MNRSLKVILVVIVLGLAGLYWNSGPEPLPPANHPSEAEAKTNAVASEANLEKRERGTTERIAAEEAVAELPQATHVFELELALHMRDEHGLPVSGHKPKLAPPGGELRAATEATDGHGNVVVRWPSRLPAAAIEIADPRGHRRLVQLQHGRPTHVTMLKGGPRTLALSYSADGTGTFRIISNDLSAALLAGQTTSHEMQKGLHPYAVFSEHGLVPIIPPKKIAPDQLANEALANVVLGDFVSGWNVSSSLSFTEIEGLQFHYTAPQQKQQSNCTIDGIVYDENGDPAANVPVVLLGSNPQPLHRTKTDPSGAFKFDKVKPNTLEVRAGGTELGLAVTTVQVVAGKYSQNIQLQRDSCIRGTLHDRDGTPIAKADVEWLSSDGRWADRTKTNADGEFLLANLPGKPGDLFAWHKNAQWRLPIATMKGVLPDTGVVHLKCDLQQHGTIRVRAEAVEGCNLAELRLRARHVDTGFSRGFQMPHVFYKKTDKKGQEVAASRASPESPWEHKHLPAGYYDVEMALPGCGGMKLGRHWLDPGTPTDLGTIAFRRPGKVHFETPDSKQPEDLRVEITAMREPFDVRLESLRTLTHDMLLSAGNYMLAVQRGDQPPHFETFSVTSDATTALRVHW